MSQLFRQSLYAVRPHSKKRIDEIENLVAQWTNSPAKLQELLDELGHRTTSRAQVLKLRVQKLMANTNRGRDTRGSSGGFGNNSRDDRHMSQELARLNAELVLRKQEIVVLQAHTASLVRDLAAERKKGTGSSRSRAHDLLQIQPGLPDFALEALRRAYAKEYHPDRWLNKMDSDKANKRFVAFQAACDEIESSRKFR